MKHRAAKSSAYLCSQVSGAFCKLARALKRIFLRVAWTRERPLTTSAHLSRTLIRPRRLFTARLFSACKLRVKVKRTARSSSRSNIIHFLDVHLVIERQASVSLPRKFNCEDIVRIFYLSATYRSTGLHLLVADGVSRGKQEPFI